MKKVIVLLILTVVFTTGCTNIISLSNNDIDMVVEKVLLKKSYIYFVKKVRSSG